jgi:outer membrane protein TolC
MLTPRNKRRMPQTETDRIDTADYARLIAEIASLHNQLAAARLRAANLEAAMRAALGAHDDGESDPLAYLRDEIEYPGAAYGT